MSEQELYFGLSERFWMNFIVFKEMIWTQIGSIS